MAGNFRRRWKKRRAIEIKEIKRDARKIEKEIEKEPEKKNNDNKKEWKGIGKNLKKETTTSWKAALLRLRKRPCHVLEFIIPPLCLVDIPTCLFYLYLNKIFIH